MWQSSEGAVRVRHTGGGGVGGGSHPADAAAAGLRHRLPSPSHCKAFIAHIAEPKAEAPSPGHFLSLRRCSSLRTQSAASLGKTGACPSALACCAGKGAGPGGLRKGPVTVRSQGTVPALPQPS